LRNEIAKQKRKNQAAAEKAKAQQGNK